ncbi:hypothetical protein DFJ63DRAFT_336399 [Scheffersomyces coipomensis]|uniref:uncharacterized protein n=1 Tax=Scheffersomyces coipomensis TaxID=1788519 RepID=UPI00315D3BFF
MLNELIDLTYVKDFIEKLFAGYSFDISQQTNVVKNYHASVELILFLINQDTSEVRKYIDQINNILDPLNIINDRTKVVLILNRFVRFDVFEPLDFNARELNITIPHFLNYLTIKSTDYSLIKGEIIPIAFNTMIDFSLSPKDLLSPLNTLNTSEIDELQLKSPSSPSIPTSSLYSSDSNNDNRNIYHHFGLLQPQIYDMEEPSFAIVFNKDKYKLLPVSSPKDLISKGTYIFRSLQDNVLDRITKYLPGLKGMYDKFRESKPNDPSIDVKQLPFIHAYTQLFFKTMAITGFISDGKTVLYIKFKPDLKVMPGSTDYWKNRIISKLNINDEHIRKSRIVDKFIFKQLDLNNELAIDINEVISQRYIDTIKLIKLYYGNKFVVQSLGNVLKPFQILETFGQTSWASFNSIVLRLVSKDGNQYILKIYDPLFTKSIIRHDFRFNESVQDSMRSFMNECCAYYILRKQSFVPKVFKVGFLTSETNSVMKQFDIDNMNLKGFYILMEYIDAQHISPMTYQNEYPSILGDKLELIHDLGISHESSSNMSADPKKLLPELYSLKYALDLCTKIEMGTLSVKPFEQSQVLENYINSKEALTERLNLKLKPDTVIIKKMKMELDPNNEIKGDFKVVFMWHRFITIDLFNPLEYSTVELNLTIGRFAGYVKQKFAVRNHRRTSIILAAFEVMINLSISPGLLISESPTEPTKKLSPIQEADEDLELAEISDISPQSQPPRKRHHIASSNNESSGGTSQSKLKSTSALYEYNRRDNKLNKYIGLFIPEVQNADISTLPQPKPDLNFDEDMYKKFLISNTFKPFESPDRVIELLKGIFPIEIKTELKHVYDIFKSPTSSFKDKLPFFQIFSQMFRECVACNSCAGVLTDGMITLYIKFSPKQFDKIKASLTDDYASWNNYGADIYRNMPCEFFSIRQNKDLFYCLLHSEDYFTSQLREAVQNHLFLHKEPIQLICEKHYIAFEEILKRLKEKLEVSLVAKAPTHEDQLKDVWSSSQPNYTTEGTIINQRYDSILQDIKHDYNDRFTFEDTVEFFKTFEIIELLGGEERFSNNGVVFKIKYQDKVCVLKIYDAIYSKAMPRNNYDFEASVIDVTRSFTKESYAYHLLKDKSFVPKVIKVGLLSGKNNIIMKSIDIPDENDKDKKPLDPKPEINLKGFFLIMDFIDAVNLGDLLPNVRKKFKTLAHNTLTLLHKENISHGDVYKYNILVTWHSVGSLFMKKKVYFVDFGSSRVSKYRHGSKVRSLKANTLAENMTRDRKLLRGLFPK